MRYPQGGGLTAERQHFREELRLQGAERFARGEGSTAIARDLRVSEPFSSWPVGVKDLVNWGGDVAEPPVVGGVDS
ncbi:hypothetical protein ACFYMF_30675, partial [Streptomyces sp. NPDC006855]